MELTRDQQREIWLISDRDLYCEAEQFLADHGAVDRSQAEGLLDNAQSFGELQRFVRHQAGRDWTGRKEHYRDFYVSLDGFLKDLRRRVRDQYGLVPQGLPKEETKEQNDYFAELLAREFLQHLVAELMFQRR
jgi:hypothetical protein